MEYKDKRKGKKARHGRDFWHSVLAEHRDSGQTVSSFCEERGLSQVTFYGWRKRLGPDTEAGEGISLARIKVRAAPVAGTEVLLPGGLILRFSGLAPVDYLYQLSSVYAVL